MATQITKFSAADGTMFDTAEEADQHDLAVATQANVTNYGAAAGLEKPQIAFLQTHMPQYLAFVETGAQPAKVVKKERKARVPKTPAPAPAADKKA